MNAAPLFAALMDFRFLLRKAIKKYGTAVQKILLFIIWSFCLKPIFFIWSDLTPSSL
jgi:hypothetical protein